MLAGISTVLISGYRTYSAESPVSYSLFINGLSSYSITYTVGDGYYLTVEYSNVSCSVRLQLLLFRYGTGDGRPGGGLDCQNTKVYVPIWESGQPRLAFIKLNAENFAETAAQIGIIIKEYRAQAPFLSLSLVGYIMWMVGFVLFLNAFIKQVQKV